MIVEFRAVPGPTGQMLAGMLQERGLEVNRSFLRENRGGDCVVSYGVRLTNETRPALNARAGWDKLEELTTMRDKGILVPPFSLDGKGLEFPILGRKRRHTKAKDIVPILQNDQEFEWRLAGGVSEYFVQYIPKQAEYRVWAYRKRPLGVYQKVMKYPERYVRGVGWNWQQGFAFEFKPEPPEELRAAGVNAIDALGLDFGAVDILHGKDGKVYVLEVNTSPGTQGARAGISNLADKITRWVSLGCPKRREIAG